MSKQLIPELSYLDIKDGNKEALKELKNALTEYGFFSIINHGLEKELLENSYAYSKKFFLPIFKSSLIFLSNNI